MLDDMSWSTVLGGDLLALLLISDSLLLNLLGITLLLGLGLGIGIRRYPKFLLITTTLYKWESNVYYGVVVDYRNFSTFSPHP